MPLATKNGLLVVKANRVAETCACCHSAPLSCTTISARAVTVLVENMIPLGVGGKLVSGQPWMNQAAYVSGDTSPPVQYPFEVRYDTFIATDWYLSDAQLAPSPPFGIPNPQQIDKPDPYKFSNEAWYQRFCLWRVGWAQRPSGTAQAPHGSTQMFYTIPSAEAVLTVDWQSPAAILAGLVLGRANYTGLLGQPIDWRNVGYSTVNPYAVGLSFSIPFTIADAPAQYSFPGYSCSSLFQTESSWTADITVTVS